MIIYYYNHINYIYDNYVDMILIYYTNTYTHFYYIYLLLSIIYSTHFKRKKIKFEI